MRYTNFAYPLFSSPSGGIYNKLPEEYQEYQHHVDERIRRDRQKHEEKSRENFAKFFKEHFQEEFNEEVDPDLPEADPEYPYSVFGLKKSSSQEDMKKAYRKGILENHPDKTGEDSDEAFRVIQEAYEYYTCHCSL
tara:strand:- start:347 stop:754 length:408 start_codon:yes stop_codon:yes gene_type:complete